MMMGRSRFSIAAAAAAAASGSGNSNGLLMKDLMILRHGQATHNPRAEAAKAAGCSFDTFFDLMRQDDSLDSPLTDLGRQQAAAVCAQHHASLLQPAELVVSSPLSRALETADLEAVRGELTQNFTAAFDALATAARSDRNLNDLFDGIAQKTTVWQEATGRLMQTRSASLFLEGATRLQARAEF